MATVAVAALLAGVAPAGAGPGPDALAASAVSALTDVRRRFGADVRLLAVAIHPEETAIDVQDPARPDHVDRRRYDAEGAVATEPVAVGRNRRQLRARLFRAAEVDAAVLPGILAAAPSAVDTEEGAVSHVLLERGEGSGDIPSWGAPRWRVHVEGPRGGGYVEYDLRGKRRRVVRW